jgi:hypothetical protein
MKAEAENSYTILRIKRKRNEEPLDVLGVAVHVDSTLTHHSPSPFQSLTRRRARRKLVLDWTSFNLHKRSNTMRGMTRPRGVVYRFIGFLPPFILREFQFVPARSTRSRYLVLLERMPLGPRTPCHLLQNQPRNLNLQPKGRSMALPTRNRNLRSVSHKLRLSRRTHKSGRLRRFRRKACSLVSSKRIQIADTR